LLLQCLLTYSSVDEITVMPNPIGGDWGDQRAVHRSVRRQRLRSRLHGCNVRINQRGERLRPSGGGAWAASPLGHAGVSTPCDRQRNRPSQSRAFAYIALAEKEEAHGRIGGERLNRRRVRVFSVAPLFTESSNDVRMHREKVFGPAACIISVRTARRRLWSQTIQNSVSPWASILKPSAKRYFHGEPLYRGIELWSAGSGPYSSMRR
jgi:hypothetical protein